MDSSESWIVVAILGAEIAFWVLLVLGLVARYVLRLKRISTALLLCVPLVDLVLITLVGVDLSGGAEPTFVHALAAVYLGFSVGFGPHVTRRVDAWFAHRFADGPRPPAAPRTGPEKVRKEWQDWLRVLTAWAIAVAALMLMKALSGWSVPRTREDLWSDELWAWAGALTIINIAWLLTGPVYSFIFTSRNAPEEPRTKETA